MAEPAQPVCSTNKSVSVMLVTDGGNPPEVQAGSTYKPHRARYTKSMLRSTLQLMGCKPRTAHKVCICCFLPKTHIKQLAFVCINKNNVT